MRKPCPGSRKLWLETGLTCPEKYPGTDLHMHTMLDHWHLQNTSTVNRISS
ncbi:hypothetical protein I79_006774 [Cricetulus griseus]|uniref:Uncharacterized protein n=1 Tax=Cricetulus griseus TaxID=10029 RepID=G3H8R4_CRIGR|nr:hypothetical protein I79_006774 [Cricetulus griseus]